MLASDAFDDVDFGREVDQGGGSKGWRGWRRLEEVCEHHG
jgi:hypothetical protein